MLAGYCQLTRSDPGRQSRLSWRRRHAERALITAQEGLWAFLLTHGAEVIDEAIARASARHQPERGWHRVDHRQVLEELPAGVGLTAAAIVERIYSDARANVDHDDVRLLELCAARIPAEAYQHAAKHPLHATRPRMRGLAHADALAGLQSELRATYLWHAALPRQVTLWRGERATSEDPRFVEQMLTCAPGDLIERGSYVLSCTVDPAVAANGEFTAGRLHTAQRSDVDGWVLRIRSSHALYIGSRDQLLADPDGVVDEREALLFARVLQVQGHREMLVDGARGLQRVHVIDCIAPSLLDVDTSTEAP